MKTKEQYLREFEFQRRMIEILENQAKGKAVVSDYDKLAEEYPDISIITAFELVREIQSTKYIKERLEGNNGK